GADAEEYLANFYGEIVDGVNNDDETDRILVSWHLRSDRAVACAAGAPANAASAPGDVRVAVPPDVEQLRRVDRAAAQQWRREVRDQLTGLLDAGGHIIGFDRTGLGGAPAYLVRPGRKTS